MALIRAVIVSLVVALDEFPSPVVVAVAVADAVGSPMLGSLAVVRVAVRAREFVRAVAGADPIGAGVPRRTVMVFGAMRAGLAALLLAFGVLRPLFPAHRVGAEGWE